MRTETRTVRIGELLGPVDWDYDFRQHFNNLCAPDDVRDEYCERAVERLKAIAEAPDEWIATTDGGRPRCGWGKVLAVGMYDGWPWWRPVPSVCIQSPLGGGEWHSFYSLTGAEKINE